MPAGLRRRPGCGIPRPRRWHGHRTGTANGAKCGARRWCEMGVAGGMNAAPTEASRCLRSVVVGAPTHPGAPPRRRHPARRCPSGAHAPAARADPHTSSALPVTVCPRRRHHPTPRRCGSPVSGAIAKRLPLTPFNDPFLWWPRDAARVTRRARHPCGMRTAGGMNAARHPCGMRTAGGMNAAPTRGAA